MDIRTTIVSNVINRISGRAEESVINLVQDAITIELNNYEVQERCTELIVHDDSNEKLMKKFVATKRVEGIAESTLQRYREINNALINYLGKPIKDITSFDIRFYLSVRRDMGKVSNRSLDGMRRCYSSFFSWLAAEGLIDKNPCAALSQIKYKKTIKKPYTEKELQKLREACDNIRDIALVDFLYSTGCRVSEISKLDISDIDFENKECTVTGKGNKERIVYLTEVTDMHLQDYLASRKDFNDALFVGKRGERLSKSGIEALLKRLGKKAGVENVHPHRYRRTLATNLLDRGMNIQDVAMILGHADLKTTQVYCYISQSNVKNAFKKYAS